MRDLRSVAAIAALGMLAALGAGCSASVPMRQDPKVAALAAPALRTFRDMAEFDAYRAHVREIVKERNLYWSQVRPHPGASHLLAQVKDAPCNPAIENCGDSELQQVVMTAQRATAHTSITNNQESEVDEGDIVKQFGRFLIVLQDGRLFSIDTGVQAADLRLVDRIDVYASAEVEAWYDELLIHDNHLVVTGYNYGESTTEINVISISEAGKFALQTRYYLQSEDYYSGSNYASRLVRGQFVMYTPVGISSSEPLSIPRIRSWTADSGFSSWQPLFDIRNVYRPIQETLLPILHVVSVCSVEQREGFTCHSRGVVGSPQHELYVSANHAYLWLTSDYNEWAFGWRGPDACPDGADLYSYAPLSAAVFQIPFGEDTVRAVHAFGAPDDQFAFDERKEVLHVLLEREPQGCYSYHATPFVFASIPLKSFAATAATLRSRDVIRVRDMTGWGMQTRYTKDYLLYGNSTDEDGIGDITVVPVANPAMFGALRTEHGVDRLEVIGDNAVVFGQTEERDLGISTIELRSRPRIANSKILLEIEESEGRSHAFNSIVDEDGSGTFGLPTVYRSKAARPWNTPSDVQFFSTDSRLQIMPVGELVGQDDKSDGYSCEVSCFDWYGNARPIFIEGRVFALTGSELVEGEIRSGVMVEVGRLRMTK